MLCKRYWAVLHTGWADPTLGGQYPLFGGHKAKNGGGHFKKLF